MITDVMPDGTLVERYHEAVLTRLGESLGASGPLLPEAAERTLEVVREYTSRVHAEGAATVAIATSAVRRADDGERFRARFREITGVELRILSGEEEATFSFIGATYGTKPAQRVAVLDIGGGSTECAVGSADVEAAVSVEIGAVRLTEMFPALAGHDTPQAARTAAADADAYVARRLSSEYATLSATSMMAVAGTPRTLGAIRFASRGKAVDGRELSSTDARTVCETLLSLSYEERKMVPGMTPQRADILVAGSIIYTNALSALALNEATITRNDLLLGYLAVSP